MFAMPESTALAERPGMIEVPELGSSPRLILPRNSGIKTGQTIASIRVVRDIHFPDHLRISGLSNLLHLRSHVGTRWDLRIINVELDVSIGQLIDTATPFREIVRGVVPEQ